MKVNILLPLCALSIDIFLCLCQGIHITTTYFQHWPYTNAYEANLTFLKFYRFVLHVDQSNCSIGGR